MTLSHKLCLCALLVGLAPTTAIAEEPSDQKWAEYRLKKGLVEPLAAQDAERSKFSRAAQPPSERRVRVVSPALARDKHGRSFAAYAVDVRYGSDWHTDIVGCIYKKSGNIFVQLEDEYRPAAFLFGKNVSAVPDVCSAGPSRDAA